MTKKRELEILVVDDDDMIRALLKAILYLEYGDSVRFAENGELALEKISEKKPDLVITDRRMPKMLGEELIRRIKENHPEIKIIFMSSDHDIDKVAKAAGVDKIVSKPFSSATIRNNIQELFPE